MISDSAREDRPSMTGLAPAVRWLPGALARICAGRLRGMDLSVRRHAVHGATVSNGVSNGFARISMCRTGGGPRLIMCSDHGAHDRDEGRGGEFPASSGPEGSVSF